MRGNAQNVVLALLGESMTDTIKAKRDEHPMYKELLKSFGKDHPAVKTFELGFNAAWALVDQMSAMGDTAKLDAGKEYLKQQLITQQERIDELKETVLLTLEEVGKCNDKLARGEK